MYLFLGTSVLFSLIVVELFFLSKIQGKKLPWKEIVTNINTGHIMVWLFRGVILFLYKYISINFTLSYFENLPGAMIELSILKTGLGTVFNKNAINFHLLVGT